MKSFTSLALPAIAALALAGAAAAQPAMNGGPPHDMMSPGGPPPHDMRGPGGPPPHGMMGPDRGPGMMLSAPDYVMKAGAGDLYEKRSSQLVLSSRNPGVRSFARGMIRDHTTSTEMVKSAAMRAGLRPRPPMLEPKQAAMIRDLQRARGSERDHIYLDQQRAAHNDALTLHQTYSRTGDARPLRQAADKIVPVVQHHIQMLQSM